MHNIWKVCMYTTNIFTNNLLSLYQSKCLEIYWCTDSITSVSFILELSMLDAHLAVCEMFAAICWNDGVLSTVIEAAELVLNSVRHFSCVFPPITMMLYTEKHAFIIECFFLSFLFKIIANCYSEKFLNSPVPSKSSIKRTVHHFCPSWSLKLKKKIAQLSLEVNTRV